MNKETGGPAFPHVADVIQMNGNTAIVKNYTQGGMTLRDYFAAKAMQVDYQGAKDFGDPDWRFGIALDAYKMADAMLKAREQ